MNKIDVSVYNADLHFHIQESSEFPGLFEYDFECSSRVREEDAERMLGRKILEFPYGYCTWDEVPERIRDLIDKQISPEKRMRFRMSAKTVLCEGEKITHL
jgi:hypothetical protein